MRSVHSGDVDSRICEEVGEMVQDPWVVCTLQHYAASVVVLHVESRLLVCHFFGA